MLRFFSVIVLIQYQPSFATEAHENRHEALEMQLKNSTGSIDVCPAELEHDVRNVQKLSKQNYELGYCLFTKNYDVGEDRLCRYKVRPIFAAHKNREIPVSCGSGKHQFLHYFGFYYCGGQDRLTILNFLKTSKVKKPTERNDFIRDLRAKHVSLEVYNVCYDVSKKTTIWTNHAITNPLLFLDPSFPEQSLHKDEISTEPFFLKPNHFLKIKQRYEAEVKKRIDFRFKMVPQAMVPDQHFAKRLWKNATNHYINMAPLSKELIPLMKAIDEGLKTASLKISLQESVSEKEELSIYTTVKGLGKPGWFSFFKNETFDTFDANIWCKFVYNGAKKQGVMIYVHNAPQKHITRRCSDENEIYCKFTEWTTSMESIEASTLIDLQYAYCCEVTSEQIVDLFSQRFDIKEVLDIHTLITQKQ